MIFEHLGTSEESEAGVMTSNDYMELVGFEMRRSGDMRGSKMLRTVEKQKDGTVHLRTLDMPDWRSKAREVDYVVGSDILSSLEDIFRRYNISAWKNLPEGIMAMDAAMTTFTFRFADVEEEARQGSAEPSLCLENWISFNSHQELPNEAFDAIDEIKTVLEG